MKALSNLMYVSFPRGAYKPQSGPPEFPVPEPVKPDYPTGAYETAGAA